MKKRRYHTLWGVGLLYLGLTLAGCSLFKQDAEELAASEEQYEEGDEANESDEAGQQETDNSVDQGQPEEGEGEKLGMQGGEGDPLAANNNDLANILNEMTQTPPAAADSAGNQPVAAATQGVTPASESASAGTGAEVASSVGSMVGGGAGLAAGPGLPEMGSKLSYIVVKGDTLAKISLRIYGSHKYWRELAKVSGFDNPSKIFPGDLVYYQLNSASLAFATEYENIARQEVLVQAGDTLGRVAERVYGNQSLWKFVWRQNAQIRNPDAISAGSKLYVMDRHTLAKLVVQGASKQAVYQSEQQNSQGQGVSGINAGQLQQTEQEAGDSLEGVWSAGTALDGAKSLERRMNSVRV